MSVKVDPAHVEGVARSPLYALMSDWKTAVPTALLIATPLYTSGKLPGFDERMELGLIVMMAGVLIFKGEGGAPSAERGRVRLQRRACTRRQPPATAR